MRKIREVLRLKWKLGLSHRQIERSVRLGHGTVCGYLRRAKREALSWEQVEGLSDAELEARLFLLRRSRLRVAGRFPTGPRCTGI